MACNGTYACSKCAEWLYGEIQMVEVEITRSGMITKISYDESEKLLTLTFNSGGAYSYKDVPKEVFDALLAAESAGKYFHSNIKNRYESEKL